MPDPLEALRRAVRRRDSAEEQITSLTTEALAAGYRQVEVADALGITKQALHNRLRRRAGHSRI